MDWTDDLELPHDGINAQHKALVDAVNALHRVSDRGDADPLDVLAFLTRYTDEHFRDEEALMRASDYPGLAEHHDAHAALLAQVEQRVQAYLSGDDPDLDDLLAFLDHWLRYHIAGADRDLVRYLRGDQASAAA